MQKPITWLGSLRGKVEGTITLITAIVGFILFLRGHPLLSAVVIVAFLLAAMLYHCIRVACATRVSEFNPNVRVPVYDKKYHPWAKACIALIVIIIVSVFALEPSRSFIVEAFRGPATPAPTPILTPTATPWPFVDSSTIYTDRQGLCLVLTDDSAPQAGRANAIKITFTISSLESYCGWYISLNGYDASAEAVLTFWVKGEAGGEQFEVGIKDSVTREGDEPKVAQVASDVWQQVSIPLDEFEGQSLASLDRLTLNLKHDLGSGTIYVADFSFGDVVP